MPQEVNASFADKVINTCYDQALIGLPLTSTAEELGDHYLKTCGRPDAAIDRLIRWQAAKCATSGFLTGLGGLITLPVAIPADIGATWYVNIRMVAAIAHIRGHDLHADRTRTAVFLCLVGSSAAEIASKFGAKVTEEVLIDQLNGIDPSALVKMNRAVMARLVTKIGEKGLVNVFRLTPLLGGTVRGTVNVFSCTEVGNEAKRLLVIPKNRRAKV
jgi:EcsC protein family